MPTKESISMALCEGRVAVVTGRGGGLRRAFCLMLAAEDAKVVVNDMGSAANGDGADATPAQQVAEMARRGSRRCPAQSAPRSRPFRAHHRRHQSRQRRCCTKGGTGSIA